MGSVSSEWCAAEASQKSKGWTGFKAVVTTHISSVTLMDGKSVSFCTGALFCSFFFSRHKFNIVEQKPTGLISLLKTRKTEDGTWLGLIFVICCKLYSRATGKNITSNYNRIESVNNRLLEVNKSRTSWLALSHQGPHAVTLSWDGRWSVINLKTFSDQLWLAHCQRTDWETATNEHPFCFCRWTLVVPAPKQPTVMQTVTPLWLFSCAFPALLSGATCPQTSALIGLWYLAAFCFIHEGSDSSSNKCKIRKKGFTQRGPDHWTESPMQYYLDNNRRAPCTHHWDDKLRG